MNFLYFILFKCSVIELYINVSFHRQLKKAIRIVLKKARGQFNPMTDNNENHLSFSLVMARANALLVPTCIVIEKR